MGSAAVCVPVNKAIIFIYRSKYMMKTIRIQFSSIQGFLSVSAGTEHLTPVTALIRATHRH